MNRFIKKHIVYFELLGVMTRILSFSILSILGKDSPLLFIWVINTLDAILLSWCSILKKDKAYIILNVFWVLVSLTGIITSSLIIH